MNAKPDIEVESDRLRGPPGSNNGQFVLSYGHTVLRLIVSDGGGWDHVSVSLEHRCPTWQEMCYVKRAMFRPDECVMQLHPAETDYVNHAEFCLHLWRPQTRKEAKAIAREWAAAGERAFPYRIAEPIPAPPQYMVGAPPEECEMSPRNSSPGGK